MPQKNAPLARMLILTLSSCLRGGFAFRFLAAVDGRAAVWAPVCCHHVSGHEQAGTGDRCEVGAAPCWDLLHVVDMHLHLLLARRLHELGRVGRLWSLSPLLHA